MRSMGIKGTVLFLSIGFVAPGCGGGVGACVGESSPGNGLCKDGWGEAECEEWDEDEVNGSSWTFYSGDSCEDLDYTHECSDGSFADNPC